MPGSTARLPGLVVVVALRQFKLHEALQSTPPRPSPSLISHPCLPTPLCAVYANWCGPCKAIAPLYEKCADTFARPSAVTFVKVNTETQKDIAQAYSVSSLPTFILFRGGREVNRVIGADPRKLKEMVDKISDAASGTAAAESSAAASGSGGDMWMGAGLPKGYGDITGQVDPKGVEILNLDDDSSPARVLFDSSKPSALKGSNATGEKDWVESGTDDQLLLFMPFQSMVKLHTIQVSLRSSAYSGSYLIHFVMSTKLTRVISSRLYPPHLRTMMTSPR